MASSPQLPDGLEGQTLAGKYRIERLLGAGGMCFVYEAEHIHLRQVIALKLLKPDFARDPTAVARFAQEAQAAAQLRSPNVARVYDVDKLPDGQPYITMELLVGNDLGTELQRRYSLPMELAVDYVCQAAQGIAEAHQLGIVHRDLKPENLFLTELGDMTERRLLKILDFGIAKNIHESTRKLTAPDAVFGTVDYMSPEQIRSASTVDSRTDIWSLGVILFELLTGRTPYVGDARSVIAQIVSDPIVPPSRYVPTLPPNLVAVVMKALAKDPEQRYQSADELRRALTQFTEGVESISRVLARIPATSIPRRRVPEGSGVRTAPELPSGVRDARTNLSFETTAGSSLWRSNVTIPAIGILVITAMFILIKTVRHNDRRTNAANVTMTAVEPPAQPPVAPPMPIVIAPPQQTVLPPPTLTVPTYAPAPVPTDAQQQPAPQAPGKPVAPARPPPKHTAPPKPSTPPTHEAPTPPPQPTTNPKIL